MILSLQDRHERLSLGPFADESEIRRQDQRSFCLPSGLMGPKLRLYLFKSRAGRLMASLLAA